mmetsp:Transcript_10586/g.19508  ORF Transcript_10586/g.19508 Transcript_10586/m.19508 type:complete len:422 (-) Transcript_10586:74-1339(-)
MQKSALIFACLVLTGCGRRVTPADESSASNSDRGLMAHLLAPSAPEAGFATGSSTRIGLRPTPSSLKEDSLSGKPTSMNSRPAVSHGQNRGQHFTSGDHTQDVAKRPQDPPRSAITTLTSMRGGAINMVAITGVFAMPSVLGSWALAVLTCSLAYVRQAYVFSLSYGLATAAIGGVVLRSSCPVTNTWVFVHAFLLLAYGVRLFAFLLWRQIGQDAGYGGPEGKLAKLDRTPRAQRTPIILSTALFYALLCSPLVFHSQVGAAAVLTAPFGIGKPLAWLGTCIAAFGLLVEAVADQQKSMFKIGLRATGEADRMCTSGLYAKCRHPNYAGEILFWAGSFILGIPSILAQASSLPVLTTLIRVACTSLGMLGILSIMLGATKRLDGRQAESAPSEWPVKGGDGEPDTYAKYKARTFKLFPSF